MEPYDSNFSAGMKIEILIPIPHAKVFSDWAVINTIDNDLLSLQLSRDILPEGVTLRVGQIIECRSVNDKNFSSHRAIVIDKGFAQELQLRLIGETADCEHREFFRIDIFLPISYTSTRKQNIYSLHKQWEWRRKQRKAEERTRRKKHLEEHALELKRLRKLPVGTTPEPPSRKNRADLQDIVLYDESWHNVIPHAVNICGGGMSLAAEQEFAAGEYVMVEILIPTLRRVVDIVARVIFANRSNAAGTDRHCYITGMQFVLIDECDRATIVNYNAQIQMQRIRQEQGFTDVPLLDAMNESNTDNHLSIRHDYDYANSEKSSSLFGWLKLVMVLGVFVFCGICMALLLFMVSSANGPLNGIGKGYGKNVESFRKNINHETERPAPVEIR